MFVALGDFSLAGASTKRYLPIESLREGPLSSFLQHIARTTKLSLQQHCTLSLSLSLFIRFAHAHAHAHAHAIPPCLSPHAFRQGRVAGSRASQSIAPWTILSLTGVAHFSPSLTVYLPPR